MTPSRERAPGAGAVDEADAAASRRAGDASLPVTVNGQRRAATPGDTVADLVRTLCDSPVGIAVARNREVVPRSRWASTPLAADDVVEIVTAAAGG